MNEVDRIIGYKKYEVKVPKDKQMPKNRSKRANFEQIDNSTRERERDRENARTFAEERKRFLERMSKNKRKNTNKKDKEKSKETGKDNYKKDDKKSKEQKKLTTTRDFCFKEPHSATFNHSALAIDPKPKPQSGSDDDAESKSGTKIMIDQAIQTSSPLNVQLSELFNDNILSATKDNSALLQHTDFTSWERRWSNCSTISNVTTVSPIPDPKYDVNYNDIPSINSIALMIQDPNNYASSLDYHEGNKKLLQEEVQYSNKAKSAIMGLTTLCTNEKLSSHTEIAGRQVSRWSEFPTCCSQTLA